MTRYCCVTYFPGQTIHCMRDMNVACLYYFATSSSGYILFNKSSVLRNKVFQKVGCRKVSDVMLQFNFSIKLKKAFWQVTVDGRSIFTLSISEVQSVGYDNSRIVYVKLVKQNNVVILLNSGMILSYLSLNVFQSLINNGYLCRELLGC